MQRLNLFLKGIRSDNPKIDKASEIPMGAKPKKPPAHRNNVAKKTKFV